MRSTEVRTTLWKTTRAGSTNPLATLGQRWHLLPSKTYALLRIFLILPMFRERHFGSVVPASGSLVVLGGRDGSAQPMAMGDIEQFDVKHFSWHPVKTKMTLERSYQCAVSLARCVQRMKEF